MAGNSGNNIGNGITDQRRRLIAGLMVKRPGITRRQLHEVIATQVKNPVTKEPYSLATVQNDVTALKERWREEAFQDTDIHISMEWAKLDEVEKTAWGISDLTKRVTALLKISERRAKLKGYDSPEKLDLTGTMLSLSHNVTLTDEQRSNAITQLLDRFPEKPDRPISETGDSPVATAAWPAA